MVATTTSKPRRAAELAARFYEQGFVVVPDFIEPDVLSNVRSEVEKIVDQHVDKLVAEGQIVDSFENEPFETRLIFVDRQCAEDIVSTFSPNLHCPGMFGLFFHPPLLEIVEELLGPEIRLYPNYSLRPKLPQDEATLVLWHQDAAYTQQKGQDLRAAQARMVNVWAPLVPAGVENGCMQFIPETHRLGLVPHLHKNKFYLQIADEYLNPYLDQAIDVPLHPGDLVLFDNLLYHRGLPNRGSTIRWSCDWRYQDATQPTFRQQRGHIARSRKEPAAAVRDAEHWTELSFV